MKKIIGFLLLSVLLTSGLLQAVSADSALTLSSPRFDGVGHYNISASGVGLHGVTSGDIVLTVPGDVVSAYLYWAGYTSTTGDDTIVVTVNDVTVDFTAEWKYGPDPWFDGDYHYVYVADITILVDTFGSNTYTLSGFNIAYEYGAGIMLVYEDPALPSARVTIYDGLDAFHFDFDAPMGPNSDVACHEFDPENVARELDVTMFVGGVLHENRPNAIWYETGTGTPPTNVIDSSSDPTGPYPLTAADGAQWDTYTTTITVPVNHEWACIQIESIPTEGPYSEHESGKGTSALLLSVGFVIPQAPGVPQDSGGDGISTRYCRLCPYWKQMLYPGSSCRKRCNLP